MTTIRFAATEDAELIADMSRQTFYETFAEHNSKEDMDIFMNEQLAKEAMMKEVAEPENIFLLAYDEDKPVGYVRMREGEKRKEFLNKPAIEIARIYAVRSSIGKGIGKALMQRVMEEAKNRNKEVIWLGVWEKNERAITFYKKAGFEKFAEHDFILGKDVQTDWLMKKEL